MSFGKRGNSPPEQVSSQSRHQSSATSNPRELLVTKSEGPDFVLFGAAFFAIAACVVIYFKIAPGQPSRADSAAVTAPIVTSDVAVLDTVRQRLATGEDGRTFEENARKKAEEYSGYVPGEIVLADDSGLEIDALGGAPGVHSARYAGPDATDADNNALLVRNLHGAANRRARFVCVIALVNNGSLVHTFRGAVEGRILDLSLAAAKKLDVYQPGVARVRLEVLQVPSPLDMGGRWAVQIGAFSEQDTARQLADRLSRRYQTARVREFSSPVGDWWVRVRVLKDDKLRAQEVARDTRTSEGGIFLVRLD